MPHPARVTPHCPAALVTAALYTYGGPFAMTTFTGFVWGLALPVLYTVVSLVKFALPA